MDNRRFAPKAEGYAGAAGLKWWIVYEKIGGWAVFEAPDNREAGEKPARPPPL